MPVGLVLSLFGRWYARLIFHGGVNNSSDKGFAKLYPEEGPAN
jgi:hypothetical protein